MIMAPLQRISLIFVLNSLLHLLPHPVASNGIRSSSYANNNDHDQPVVENLLDQMDGFRGGDVECPKQILGPDTSQSVARNGDLFAEVSYMAVSKQKVYGNTVVWLGSDGEQNSISAVFLETGELIATFRLAVSMSRDDDWESMSLGPCKSTDTVRDADCIYAGVVGDNDADEDCIAGIPCSSGRNHVKIYKFEEPDLQDPVLDADEPLPVVTLVLDYRRNFGSRSDGFPTDRANSEAMFVDRSWDMKGGRPSDIYVITKYTWPGKRRFQRIAKVPSSEHEHLVAPAVHRFSFEKVGKPYNSDRRTWVGVDMSMNGRYIALRNRRSVFFHTRRPDQTVAEALETPPCSLRSSSVEENVDTKQFESVAFLGSNEFIEASECFRKQACDVPLHRYALNFDEPVVVTSPPTRVGPLPIARSPGCEIVPFPLSTGFSVPKADRFETWGVAFDVQNTRTVGTIHIHTVNINIENNPPPIVQVWTAEDTHEDKLGKESEWSRIGDRIKVLKDFSDGRPTPLSLSEDIVLGPGERKAVYIFQENDDDMNTFRNVGPTGSVHTDDDSLRVYVGTATSRGGRFDGSNWFSNGKLSVPDRGFSGSFDYEVCSDTL